MEWKHTLVRKKILSAVVSKEGHADSLLRNERIHHIWFPWKRCNYKQCFLLPTSAIASKFLLTWVVASDRVLFMGQIEQTVCKQMTDIKL